MVAMAMAPKEDNTLKSYTVNLGGDDEKTLPRMQRSVKLREDSHTICLSMRELADPTDVKAYGCTEWIINDDNKIDNSWYFASLLPSRSQNCCRIVHRRFLTGALCVIFRVALKLILFKILLQSLDRVYLQWRKIKEKCSTFNDKKRGRSSYE